MTSAKSSLKYVQYSTSKQLVYDEGKMIVFSE